MTKIGVLALQGDVREHLASIEATGEAVAIAVRTPEEIQDLQGLIIPGGESTTVGKLMARWGVDEAIREKAKQGMAIYGTCTGMILLAKRIEGSDQHRLDLMDVTVRRNAFGRQIDSFESDLVIPAIDDAPIRAVYIRAPIITETGPETERLLEIPEGVAMARHGRLLASAFHPELTPDLRIHRYFIKLAKASN